MDVDKSPEIAEAGDRLPLPPVSSPRRALSAFVMAAWGIFVLVLVITGRATYYLSPNLIWLAVVSSALMLHIAWRLWRARLVQHFDADSPWHEMECRCRTRHLPSPSETLGILALLVPLIAVAVVPAGTLGAYAAQQKGLGMSLSGESPDAALYSTSTDEEPELGVASSEPVRSVGAQDAQEKASAREVSMRELVYSAAYEMVQNETGIRPGSVVGTVGFISRPDPKQPNRVVATRFLVTCCVADAIPIGVELRGQFSGLRDDTWVSVSGRVGWPGRDSYDITRGFPTPWMDVESLSVIAQPDDIYVY